MLWYQKYNQIISHKKQSQQWPHPPMSFSNKGLLRKKTCTAPRVPSTKAQKHSGWIEEMAATSSFLLLVAMLSAPSSFLLLVVRPGAPTSVLAPSDALTLVQSVFCPCTKIVRTPMLA